VQFGSLGKLKAAAKALYRQKPPERPGVGGFDLGTYYAEQEANVWPENWPSALLFSRLATQWRVGMGGRYALDYCSLYPLIDRITDTQEQWFLMFDDIREMESAALEAMDEAS